MPKKYKTLPKRDSREERKRFVIFVDGKTEAIYLGNFKSRGSSICFDIRYNEKSTSSLLQYACDPQRKKECKGYDKVWVVCDRDKDQNNSDDKFNQSYVRAENNGIEVAYSNDAFELWFLLHFEDVYSSMPRSDISEKLKKHIPGYDKAQNIYEDLTKENRYNEAVKRAKKLMESVDSKNPAGANPSTKVYLLTEELLSPLKRIRSKLTDTVPSRMCTESLHFERPIILNR